MHLIASYSHFIAFHGGRGSSAALAVGLVAVVLLLIAFFPSVPPSEYRNRSDVKKD